MRESARSLDTDAPPTASDGQSRERRRRFVWILLILSVVGLGIRVGFAAADGARSATSGDANFYYREALQIADGDGYVRPYELHSPGHQHVPTAEHPPLFAYLLAAPAALGLRSLFSLEVVSSIVGAIGVAMIGLLGRRCGGDAVGLLAAGIAACYPILFQPAALLFSEPLFILLVTLTLLLAYRLLRPSPERAKWWEWSLLGVLIGLASLARAEGLLLIPLLAFPLAWRRGGRWPARVAPFAIATAAALIVIAPWTIRNETVFHAFVPISTNSSTALTGANCDATYYGYRIGSWEILCTYAAAAHSGRGAAVIDAEHNEVARFDLWQQQAFTYIGDHLSRLPLVIPARVLRTWSIWDPGDLLRYDVRDAGVRAWQLAGFVMFWTMLPLAVWGMVLLRRAQTRIWPLVVPIGIVTFTSIVFHGSTRTRAGAEVSVIIFAAVGAVELATRARSRATR
jgi:4-amino-4-deoxy-L-arabinose transferase-like glycosyltransferase